MLAEGAPYQLRERRHGRKGALRCKKDVSFGGRGAVSAYKGGVVGEKGRFWCQKGFFAGGRDVVST